MNLTNVQQAAFNLIQSDARFLYAIVDILNNAKRINSNYIMMCQPYIGVFANGAEQWCRKVGLNAPKFTPDEKLYYDNLRQGHKIFEDTYENFSDKLLKYLIQSDSYFYNNLSSIEKTLDYYNVGTDLCNGEFCGNTIICMINTPIQIIENKDAGNYIKNISVIAGKLANFFKCTELPTYKYDDINNLVTFKDYHFYNNCPLKLKNNFSFVLFSVLCNINYIIEFIDKYFVDEIPQKLKFVYLQYYYLCDFIKNLNDFNGSNYVLDTSLKNRNFRNCIAHYGLGQFMENSDIIETDILKGLTYKAFNMDYISTKQLLYKYLKDLTQQIKSDILL